MQTEIADRVNELTSVPANQPPLRKGQILRVNKNGLLFLEDLVSRQRFSSTFDRIRGYSGETARELGLRAGLQVEFTVIDGVRIETIDLTAGTTEPDLLKVSEVAQLLRVSERMIYNMIKRGELAHVRIGRLTRVPNGALKSFLGS